jgi:ligand-binding sensor domain-containing protein/signal transduction histidine kinase
MCARYLILGILLIVVQLLNAQQQALRQYTAVDGLPQSQVNAIVEDANGYLWIGTNGGGLARFDGKEFKTYNTLDGLLSNVVTSLMLDAKQNLWIVHPHGISRFNGIQFTVFQSPLPNPKRLRRIFEQSDSVFFITQAGTMGKIYGDSVYFWGKSILADKSIFSAVKLRSQQLAFYLNDSSFLLMDKEGKRKIISHKESFSRVLSLFHYQTKFIIESDQGYFSMNTTTGSFEKMPFTFDKHVVAYDSLNKFFWDFTKSNLSFQKEIDGEVVKVLTDVMVSQIHFDKEGNTWIGTNGRGLYKYAKQDFDRCASDKLNAVMAIARDLDGATWIGSSEKGLWKIHQGKTKHYVLENKEQGIFDIKISPQGELWIATGGGLGRYDAANDHFLFYNRENGLSSQYIVNIDFDEAGGLWCGTTGAGINYFDGDQFTSYTSNHGLKGQLVHAIRYFRSEKALFIGTEFGLSRLQNNLIKKLTVPELTNTSVFSINVYQDSLLLIGSSGAGVLVFDPRTNTVKKLLATKDGLPSNLIYFVAADQDQYIWVGTEQGINRIKLNKSLELVENLHYGFENGLTGVETNQNAFYFGDEKFFGLIDGLYQFNDNQNLPEKSNDLHLTSVELFYGEFPARNFSDSTTGFFKVPYQPVFPSNKNHITFHFNRVSKRNPQSVRYKYYLKNFDMAWSQPTPLGQVTYGNLPAGDYTLHVLATNKQGSWDTVPLLYSFTIEAPFYATSTFVAFVSIILIGLLFLILSLRIRSRTKRVLEIEHIRQQEQAHLRKEIARDFHDEMGNQLTRIINYVSVMKLSKNGQAVELYNKVEDSAKYLYTGTRDFIWSIDPQNDELSRLFLHIRDFGEKLFEEKEIQFRAYNKVKDPIRAPYGFSREANLIMKEAMTNVFNHSQAKNVAFILKQDNERFEMILEDDGIGFSMSEITHLNGIKNMRIRAERIKSVLRIQNNTSKSGTIVSLSFTITKTKKYVNRI